MRRDFVGGALQACLVDSEGYALRCYRYIDLNPVRARMTDDAASYAWSSAPSHCNQRADSRLKPHAAYTALGSTAEARADAYRQLLHEVLSDDGLVAIRTYLQQQRAWGRDDFRAMVEAKTRRFAGIRSAHRPPKPTSPDK